MVIRVTLVDLTRLVKLSVVKNVLIYCALYTSLVFELNSSAVKRLRKKSFRLRFFSKYRSSFQKLELKFRDKVAPENCILIRDGRQITFVTLNKFCPFSKSHFGMGVLL